MDQNKLYMCAPVNALVEGIYEQPIPFSKIRQHGDFGIGTFNNLDGEMVMLDGEIYQIPATGRVNHIVEDGLTPFACVTFFKAQSQDELDREIDYQDFLKWLLNLLPSSNIFYALRIDGRFESVKTRSVPKQENYRPLVDVAREQPTFSFTGIDGTLVGFYTPPFMGSVSVPGLHLHFLSADKQHGGHLLECRPSQIKVQVQFLPTLELGLPIELDYLTWNFQRDIEQDLNKAEK